MKIFSSFTRRATGSFPAMGAWLPAALLGLLILGQAFWQQPFAQDDLLRNVTAYAWGFDYSRLYPFSPGVPRFDPYLGFDWVLGKVSASWSPGAAMVTAQVLGSFALLAATLAPLRNQEDRAFKMTAVLALVLATLVTSRLVGGRPEVWATAWLLSAATLPPRVWLALGLLVSPVYWLLPVYAAGAFLLKGTWRTRLGYAVAAASLTSLFWLGYAGVDWLHAVLALPELGHRPVPAAEAGPLRDLLGYPGTWLLLMALAGTAAWHREKLVLWRWGLVVAVFLAIGSVRHVLVLAPAAAVWMALQPWPKPRESAWSLLTLGALVCGLFAAQQLSPHRGPHFQVPANSVVLTGYNQAVFYLPFHNPGSFAMAPSIESGWDTPQVVLWARAVSAGTLSCQDMSGSPFTHVLSPKKAALQGECFQKVQEEPDWVLWDVRHPS